MKEFYISPEVKLLAFLPQEKLAASGSFDDLLNAELNGGGGLLQGPGNETELESGDVFLPL